MTDKLVDLARRIGTRIVQLRKSEGLNQQQLATRAQISKSILSMIENGQRVPSMLVLQRLVTALGLAAEQALIDASDQVLRQLWSEVYEGSTALSVQLRAGQDLKLPQVQEAELVAVVATPPPPPVPVAVPAPDATVLAAVLAPLQEQLMALGEAQRELQRTLGEAGNQSLRNLTGIAHHIDRLGQRLDRVCLQMQAQTDELAALRKEVAALAPPPAPPPPPESPLKAPLDKVLERVDALAKDLGEQRRSVRLSLLQSQHEAQLLRVQLSQLTASLNRRR